jgi:hypothetical protein
VILCGIGCLRKDPSTLFHRKIFRSTIILLGRWFVDP